MSIVLHTLARLLPEALKGRLRRVYDGWASVPPAPHPSAPSFDTPAPGELLPPPELQAMVGGSFRAVGAEFLGHLDQLCHLEPTDRVLDVGCGCGRLALPLTKRLTGAACYEGFDVWGVGIMWCRQHITPDFPGFRFSVMDVKNSFYNPTGTHEPWALRFPWDDAAFDLVILASLFTHLLPRDMEHYLSEIARVMKPGGRCLITYFLLNDESNVLIDHGKGSLNFPVRLGRSRAMEAQRPEAAIAFEEPDIRALYAREGLELVDPIQYGAWCGRPRFLSFQDIVVARKPFTRPAREPSSRPRSPSSASRSA